MKKNFKLQNFVLTLVIQSFLLASFTSQSKIVHNCVHDKIQKNVKIQAIKPILTQPSMTTNPNNRNLVNTIIWRDFRITVNYEIMDKFITDNNLSAVKQTHAKTIMASVKKYISHRISVFSYDEMDTSSISDCGDFTTPASVRGVLTTDLVILVVAVNNPNQSYFALALSCASIENRFLLIFYLFVQF